MEIGFPKSKILSYLPGVQRRLVKAGGWDEKTG
jgi:hypothetical protein